MFFFSLRGLGLIFSSPKSSRSELIFLLLAYFNIFLAILSADLPLELFLAAMKELY